MVKERKKQYNSKYTTNNMIGACLCIMSLIPLFAGAIFNDENILLLTIITAISIAYWLITTAIYLAYSLTTNEWKYSWIVWVVAGVIYPAVIIIFNAFGKRK